MEAYFYGSIAILGVFVILGMFVWLKRLDKKAALAPTYNDQPTNPLPKELQFIPTAISLRDCEEQIPLGSEKAIVCDWDDKRKPIKAAFRAKRGNGRIVTAKIVFFLGYDVWLRHKQSEPIFKRPFVA